MVSAESLFVAISMMPGPVKVRLKLPTSFGLDPDTTDSVVGERARLYVQGASRWEIVFVRQEDVEDVLPDEDPPIEPGTLQP